MNVEETLVSNILKTGYEDIPHNIVQITKRQILDGLGVILAGTTADGIKELVELMQEWGGAEQATIIGHGIKVPAPNAAQVNAAMMHALDFDDSSDVAAMHPGVPILSTCLALAEYLGKLSGRDFITCMALGTNFVHRMGRATRPKGALVNIGWHTTSMYGYLGSAAISSKILNLNPTQTLNAFGIAFHQSAGTLQCVFDGAQTKRMGAGFAARGGMVAALMARKGITGASHWLTGLAGMINVYHNGDFDTNILLKDFTTRFDALDLTFKPYPCCRITHCFIDAALKLINENGITKDMVKEITVFGGEGAYNLCVPLEDRCSPKNTVASQFSVPWAVATAIVKRKATISDFGERAIKDPATLDITHKITPILDGSLVGHGIQPGKITIKTLDGKEFTAQEDCPLGNPEKPMSQAQFEAKFRDCASHAIKPLSEKKIARLTGLVNNLEQLDDVTEIIKSL